MPIIQVLDQNTINQIAAGEVIERPSAVVKELAENSVDAGASAITVEIKEGGISFIRITDNGKGIGKDDIRSAFLRHATSKIRSAEDLLHVSSLGFRGEALSSIASIAQVELITKSAGDFTGYRYVIEGGEEGSNGDHGLEPIGCPEGSTFIIRNLFYNTPARRKFLKTPTTEAGYIHEVMERIAVSHPEIAVKFIQNGQTKIQTPGNDNQKDVIYYLYGREIAANVTEISESYHEMSIAGFIGKPVITRGNRNYENYFLNGRFVRNPIISRAIEDAYKPYMMQHRYPFTSLQLRVPPEVIDVNVHPAKLEVRFRNTEALYQFVFHAVSEGLRSKELIPETKPGKDEKAAPPPKQTAMPEPFETKRRENVKKELKPLFTQESLFEEKSEPVAVNATPVAEDIPAMATNPVTAPATTSIGETVSSTGTAPEKESDKLIPALPTAGKHPQADRVQEESFYHVDTPVAEEPAGRPEIHTVSEVPETDPKPMPEPMQSADKSPVRPFLSNEAVPERRIIGQLFGTYWLFEYEEQLYLLDQHAAHEKVLFERTMKRLSERNMESQNLMPPIVITLSPREEEALRQIKDYLEQTGFEVEHFGGREYAVSAVPVDLFQSDAADMFTAILDDYMDSDMTGTPEAVLERVATMSCKAAVKGNTVLTEKEAKALVEELMTLENPYHCPHGRPTMISMSKYEIEKKFKRIV